MITRRDGVDLRKTRMLQASGQYDVANDSIPPQAYRRETHSGLKGDTRFFGNNAHRSAALHELREVPE
ncbi:MAG: hypothetical protein ABSB65_03830 [Candidatus Acidiferrales bacterium]